MEQLEQIDLNYVNAPECAKIEVCVEKADDKVEKVEQVKVHKKPVNSRLLRLIRKSKYNARYIEELIPIERLRHQRVYRNYAIY